MASPQEIIRDIDAHMRQCGGSKADWVVGIAADAKSRLFSDHGVSQTLDSWIHRQANSSRDARAIEKAYLDTGHDGGPGGGDDRTTQVYAYRKSSRTNP